MGRQVGLEWIKRGGRSAEGRIWPRWLANVPRMRRQFCAAIEDDDPLLYNETASVGLLAAAASRSGMLALAEYVSSKRSVDAGKWNDRCRCDLWLYDLKSDWSWSFEFKQVFCRPNAREKTIAAALQHACEDVWIVDTFQANWRFGGLLISAREKEKSLSEATVTAIKKVATDQATVACRIGGSDVPVYLLLKRVKRGRRRKAAK